MSKGTISGKVLGGVFALSAIVVIVAASALIGLGYSIRSMDAIAEHADATLSSRAVRIAHVGLTLLASAILGAIGLLVFGSRAVARSLAADVVTERQTRLDADRAEGFLAAVVEQVPIGVIIAEAPSGRVINSNLGSGKIFQRPWLRTTSVADYADWNITRNSGERYEATDLPLARALRGETIEREENKLQRADGGWNHIEWTAGPVRDGHGKVVAAVVAFADVTGRARDAEERELFLGALGHDLRNPLAAVRLAAESLQRRRGPIATNDAALHRIVRCSQRMDRLISELVDFAQTRAGGLPMHHAAVNLHEISTEAIAELCLSHPDRLVVCRGDDSAQIDGDRERLLQVVHNLVMNALKYGEPDAPIEIHVGVELAGAVMQVHNEGPIIPPDAIPTLFLPYRRATDRGNGVGLGLYIAHHIVLSHGGSIEVESTETRGTTFRVRLPRSQPMARPHLVSAAPDARATG